MYIPLHTCVMSTDAYFKTQLFLVFNLAFRSVWNLSPTFHISQNRNN